MKIEKPSNIRVFFRKYKILCGIVLLAVISDFVVYIMSTEHVESFKALYSNQDLHYNLITFNSVIAGFQFSGLSILISLISNNSIKRLWDNGYMDCMYKSGVFSIVFSVASILISFSQVIIDLDSHDKLICIMVSTEIILSLSSIALFVYCVYELLSSIKILRNDK